PTCARRRTIASRWRRTCCIASISKPANPEASPPSECTTMDARSSPDLAAAAGEVAGGVGQPVPHDSAHLHVSGEAVYTDDIPEPRGLLHLAVGMSRCAHARIRSLDLRAVREAPGVVAVITAEDILGENTCGPVLADDPILAP